MKSLPNGLFISFEGPEGAGKSTHCRMVAERLRQAGYAVLLTREPGGSPLGEELRRLLKHFGEPGDVCDLSELLMFGASRAQHMQTAILPHLEAGGIVLCDRFADSTTVYQGMARGLDMAFVLRMHNFTMGERWPDRTLLLDLPVEETFHRTTARRLPFHEEDRIEAESRDFHARVRAGFIKLARENPERFRVLATDRELQQVQDDVYREVCRALDAF